MRLALVSGTGSRDLARTLAREIGAELECCGIERFPDGEISVTMGPVRGADVYLVQGTAPPVHDNLAELLLLADAARRSGAARVSGIVPYLAYARQDRREAEGEAVGGRVAAEAIGSAVDRVVLVDPHAAALEGFFPCPVERLSAVPLLAECVRPMVGDHVVVAPDLGAVKRAARFARALGLGMASVRKRRLSGHDVEVLGIDGDVRGRPILIVDDMISTGATIVAAANAARAVGATRVIAVATHGLFAPPSVERLSSLELDALVVSDSVPARPRMTLSLTVVGLAPLLASAVERLHRDAPLAELIGQR